ncbi:phosphonate ABC transporter substrate-binding protein [Epibacterium sp. SM1979]|uniref:Phosphonate ABC transporter substrate-binding protein n=1 Tax=Tritonibacter litoralis TaxID=2662264 RepID=A0A843Y710_9RHOB|nr:phosphonate ABC transporter substrate-binding protein [Tritonibacter litoralis]MQQ06930.1 phosphonate ABC transporter substrate-binding protein [Tritonibacter litoralis]
MRFITAAALAALVATPALAEGWKDQYQVLKFGVLSGENEKDRIARYTPLEEFLENELGIQVEIFTAGNYDGVIQALAADQIEIARLGSSSYAAAYTATDGGVVPTLTDVKKDGTTGYYSIVVTRCDSGIKSLEDAKGKVHAFADPDSTSGYAVPYWNMVNKEGFKPEEHFGTVTFGGSHEADVQGVYNGTFDTASTYQNNEVNGIYQRMEAKGMIEPGQICKIWQSPEITTGPWTFRKNLPEGMIEDVTVALEKFAAEDEEGFKLYSSFDPEDENPKVGFQRVDAERYQWIVDMRAWIKEQRRAGS